MVHVQLANARLVMISWAHGMEGVQWNKDKAWTMGVAAHPKHLVVKAHSTHAKDPGQYSWHCSMHASTWGNGAHYGI
jgi:hypothetical protein